MKTIKHLLILLSLVFLTSGCVHKIDKQGLTLAVSEDSLNESISESFPINEDFIFGSVKIENPKLSIPKNSQRIQAKINMQLSTFLTPTQKGSFSLSGAPYFDKKSASIFLKEIKIEELTFASFKMGKTFSNTFLKTLEPMIEKAFKEYPIYKIPKDSFQGSFVKDIKIEDTKLLVTYGI